MKILRKLYYALPPSLRFVGRRLWYLPLDLFEWATGRRPPMVPPRGLIYTGAGDFVAQGKRMLGHFVDAGLKPHHRVLDVGSGIGRMAVPLTGYLLPTAGYAGFDVVYRGVRWCQRHISKRFPHFSFTYVPINNDLYRASGLDASSFRFPYPDASFDFAILTSVFTHMLPHEVAHYLKELRRVLVPGGRCVATFFVWNEATEALSAPNREYTFPHDRGYYRLMDDRVQSANVALGEAWLHATVADAGLKMTHLHLGFWRGLDKAGCKDFQDLAVLEVGE